MRGIQEALQSIGRWSEDLEYVLWGERIAFFSVIEMTRSIRLRGQQAACELG